MTFRLGIALVCFGWSGLTGVAFAGDAGVRVTISPEGKAPAYSFLWSLGDCTDKGHSEFNFPFEKLAYSVGLTCDGSGIQKVDVHAWDLGPCGPAIAVYNVSFKDDLKDDLVVNSSHLTLPYHRQHPFNLEIQTTTMP